MQKLLLLLCVLVYSFACTAKDNYLRYFDAINRAEEKFVMDNNAVESIGMYDAAFKDCSKPFISDAFVAAEIAFYSGDTTHFFQFIKLCFDGSMNMGCLHNGKIFESLFANKALLERVQNLYDNRVVMSVDVAVHDSVYAHFYREQLIKKHMGMARSTDFGKMWAVNKENIAYFNTFLQKGTFPSEQMIGMFTEDGSDDFVKKYNLEPYQQAMPQIGGVNANKSMMITGAIPDDYELVNKTALVSYLHYPCAFFSNKDLFWKAVENGYIHVKDYCMMEEWFVHSFGNNHYVHDCKEEWQTCYYNIFYEMMTTNPELLKQVEKNRAAMHLQKFAVDQKKGQLEHEKGFVFFFGFLNKR